MFVLTINTINYIQFKNFKTVELINDYIKGQVFYTKDCQYYNLP